MVACYFLNSTPSINKYRERWKVYSRIMSSFIFGGQPFNGVNHWQKNRSIYGYAFAFASMKRCYLKSQDTQLVILFIGFANKYYTSGRAKK